MKRFHTAAIAVAFATAAALATAAGPVNVDGASGVAVDGFDPVAFFTEQKPVNGDFQISSVHNGATYYFASAQNKATFEADPDRYAPQYGGFCAFGVSKGALFPVDVKTWQVVGGKLYLNLNPGIQKMFNQDVAAVLQTADANWPGLAAKHEGSSSR